MENCEGCFYADADPTEYPCSDCAWAGTGAVIQYISMPDYYSRLCHYVALGAHYG